MGAALGWFGNTIAHGSDKIFFGIPEVAFSPDTQVMDIAVDVTGDSRRRLRGNVWWILAEAGRGDPWAKQAYRSTVIPVDLESGERLRLRWSEKVAVPSGTYQLVGVSREERSGSSRHSDHWVSRTQIGVTDPPLLRFRAPGDVSIQETIARTDGSNPATLGVDLDLESRATTRTPVLVRWSLVPASAGDLLRWWSWQPAYTSSPVPLTLEPGARRRIHVTERVALAPDNYLVRVSILPADPEEEALDDVLIPSPRIPAAPFDPSVIRGGLPSGPVMVRSIQSAADWHEGRPASVTVNLENLAGASRRARVWWILAPAGSTRPWESAVLRSETRLVDLAPRRPLTVSMPAPTSGPAGGTYELSVWVHTAPVPLQWAESDAARFSSLIRFRTGRIVIGAPEVRLSPDGATMNVGVEVTNDAAQASRGRVWWVLSMPGAGNPWDRVDYRSAIRAVKLKPGETARVTWTETTPLPKGSYELAALVHHDVAGAFRHSDARAAPTTVSIRTERTPLRFQGPQLIAARSVEVTVRDGNPLVVSGRLNVANLGDVARDAVLRWHLVKARGPLVKWHTRPVVFTSALRRVKLGPREERSLTLDDSKAVPPGTYQLRLTVRSGATLADDLLVRAPAITATAFDPSVVRGGLPARDVMIERIEAPALWHRGGLVEVRVRLRNLGTAAVKAKTWWVLAPANEKKPWERAVASATPVELRLAGRSATTVTVSATPQHARGGVFELSAWAHSGSPFAHSDGVRYRSRIRYFTDRLLLGRPTFAVGSDGKTVSVSVHVSNDDVVARSGRVWWLLAPPGSAPPWERESYRSAVREVSLEPGQTLRLEWSETVAVPPGSYELAALAHMFEEGAWVHSDSTSAQDRATIS